MIKSYINSFIIGLLLFILLISDGKAQDTLFAGLRWKNGAYNQIDEILYDIDRDLVADTISVCKIMNWSDPGDFHELKIKFSSGKQISVYNLGDWVNMNKEQEEYFHAINNVNSNRFIIAEISKEKNLLFLFGYSYASSPGKLTIIELRKNNAIPVFQAGFDLQKIEDIDNDGEKEIIGYRYFSERCCYEDSISVGATYNPFHVLKMVNDTLVTDTGLSENYNIKNYAGFFGLSYDERKKYFTIQPNIHGDFKPYFYFEKYRIYPQTSLIYLTADDLNGYSKDDLRLMRNEIFAFHGYKFKSRDMNEYFRKFDWYKPDSDDVTGQLNCFERANIKIIKALEQ